jgi:hypothetical protein
MASAVRSGSNEGMLGAGGIDKSHGSPRSIDFRIRLMSRDGRHCGVPVSSLRKSADRYSIQRFDGSLRFAVWLPSLGRRLSFFAAGVLEFENFAVDKSIAALAMGSR